MLDLTRVASHSASRLWQGNVALFGLTNVNFSAKSLATVHSLTHVNSFTMSDEQPYDPNSPPWGMSNDDVNVDSDDANGWGSFTPLLVSAAVCCICVVVLCR